MSGRGKSIASHSTVVLAFIGGLSRRSQANNHISSLNASVVNHIGSVHTGGNRRIHNNRTHQIPNICGLPTCAVDMNVVLGQIGDQFFRPLNNGSNNLTGDIVFVSSNGR